MIRTQVAPETIVPALRKVLHAADPALPLVRARTQQAQIDEDLADQRRGGIQSREGGEVGRIGGCCETDLHGGHGGAPMGAGGGDEHTMPGGRHKLK